MRDSYIIRTLASNLRTVIETRLTTNYTVTNIDVTNSTTTSLAFTGALPTNSLTWYPFSRIEFGSFHDRVILAASASPSNVSWRTPLPEGFTLPSSVVINSAPLTEATVYVGGGPAFSENISNQLGAASPHSPSGRSQIVLLLNGWELGKVGLGYEYGAMRRTYSGVIQTYYSFPNSEVPADSETAWLNFSYLNGQVESVFLDSSLLSSEYNCRVFLEDGQFGYYPRVGSTPQASRWVHWGHYTWMAEVSI